MKSHDKVCGIFFVENLKKYKKNTRKSKVNAKKK